MTEEEPEEQMGRNNFNKYIYGQKATKSGKFVGNKNKRKRIKKGK